MLRATGAAIAAELGALGPDMAGWHPAPGECCVKECVGHLRNHYRQLQASIQAYVWPAMGNSQRFSQPH
jgi:hypothetical protein